MTLVYIHGASATGESFNYIREHIGGNDMVINYDSRNGFENNLKSIEEQLRPMKDVFFIGHSLGGIYSIHLAFRIFNFFFSLFSSLKFATITKAMLENLCLDKRKNKFDKFSENLNVLSLTNY